MDRLSRAEEKQAGQIKQWNVRQFKLKKKTKLRNNRQTKERSYEVEWQEIMQDKSETSIQPEIRDFL